MPKRVTRIELVTKAWEAAVATRGTEQGQNVNE